MSHESLTLKRGNQVPLLISVPHSGAELPEDLLDQFLELGKQSQDSDWFTDLLYGPIADTLGGSIIVPRYSRYLIDLNRPANNENLYPGQVSTGLCPTLSFEGDPLYVEGCEPDEAEELRRIEKYWRPYHTALKEELARLTKRFGYALLWEGHSIRSEVPRLFTGRLPDFNLGTHSGQACASPVSDAIEKALEQGRGEWTTVSNGRFKGGFITRNYGAPHQSQHAVQLELSQRVYLRDELLPRWDEGAAAPARALIVKLIQAGLDALESLAL